MEISSEGGLDQAIQMTRELVANPEVPAIFEGTFENGGVLVRVDILPRRKDGRWRLIEVKSSTDVKEDAYHFEDVAIQYRVLSRGGLDVASACLAHINRDYVFQGGSIDVRRFFKVRNLTRRVEKMLPELTFRLRAFFSVLNHNRTPNAQTSITHHSRTNGELSHPLIEADIRGAPCSYFGVFTRVARTQAGPELLSSTIRSNLFRVGGSLDNHGRR